MDSDTALRFDLTTNQYEEFPAIDAENYASAVGIAADEGETQEEAGDAEDDERGADDENEEESEGEAES